MCRFKMTYYITWLKADLLLLKVKKHKPDLQKLLDYARAVFLNNEYASDIF